MPLMLNNDIFKKNWHYCGIFFSIFDPWFFSVIVLLKFDSFVMFKCKWLPCHSRRKKTENTGLDPDEIFCWQNRTFSFLPLQLQSTGSQHDVDNRGPWRMTWGGISGNYYFCLDPTNCMQNQNHAPHKLLGKQWWALGSSVRAISLNCGILRLQVLGKPWKSIACSG